MPKTQLEMCFQWSLVFFFCGVAHVTEDRLCQNQMSKLGMGKQLKWTEKTGTLVSKDTVFIQ